MSHFVRLHSKKVFSYGYLKKIGEPLKHNTPENPQDIFDFDVHMRLQIFGVQVLACLVPC